MGRLLDCAAVGSRPKLYGDYAGRCVLGCGDKVGFFGLLDRQGDIELFSNFEEAFCLEFLLLVADVEAFTCLAHAVTLDSMRKDHSWAALVVDGLLVAGKDLQWIMATATEGLDLVV